ncbi:unnamed protein product [Parnassius mnemosyne]|uniref:Uncharacterized protein n=1 Tax=Parnassius mnemosyne TaxID=213953 RepID=A0AAV1M7T1_9NEOP
MTTHLHFDSQTRIDLCPYRMLQNIWKHQTIDSHLSIFILVLCLLHLRSLKTSPSSSLYRILCSKFAHSNRQIPHE